MLIKLFFWRKIRIYYGTKAQKILRTCNGSPSLFSLSQAIFWKSRLQIIRIQHLRRHKTDLKIYYHLSNLYPTDEIVAPSKWQYFAIYLAWFVSLGLEMTSSKSHYLDNDFVCHGKSKYLFKIFCIILLFCRQSNSPSYFS